jgi:hypothetical protein
MAEKEESTGGEQDDVSFLRTVSDALPLETALYIG